MYAQPQTGRYTLRDVSSNVTSDASYKDRYAYLRPAAAVAPPSVASALSSNFGSANDGPAPIGRRSGSFAGRAGSPAPRHSAEIGRRSNHAMSPHADRLHAHDPAAVTDFAQDIAEMYLEREKSLVRDPNYMSAQTEINEKMRTILIDWIVDVHLKFKLHEESFFLAVDLIDRYLAVSKVSRSQLQLVGVVCVLLAAKYEEIWPPEVKDCIHISANTYTRDDILKMERAVCAALSFKLTVPTPYPMLARLLEVTDADLQTRSLAMYFLEHAVLDYKNLQFLPSHLANASLYLAQLTLRKSDPWNFTTQYYSRCALEDIKPCVRNLLDFTTLIANSKYQAIRRKYTATKYAEVARLQLPSELPF